MGAKLRGYLARHHLALIALFVALGGTSYAVVGKNQVTSKSIKKGAVKSADVKDDAITGRDVDETRLESPSVGRFDFAQSPCDPGVGGDALDCGEIEVNLRTRSRVLVIGDGSVAGDADGAGLCQLRMDGAGISLGYTVYAQAPFSLVGVTDPLAPGSHTATVICSEIVNDVSVSESHIAAVTLGPG